MSDAEITSNTGLDQGSAPPGTPQYGLSILPKGRAIDREFAEKVRLLEAELKRRVLVMFDKYEGEYRAFTYAAYYRLRRHKSQLPRDPIAILLDSPGGAAAVAFKTASLLRRRCGGYSVVVPQFALSAATLFALGAETICLADDAALGPLDAQLLDHDVEEGFVSALDTVQAVEQLDSLAIEVAVKMLRYLHDRTQKKYNLLLRPALHFASEITQPLFNKIDAIRYSRQSRMLKEAQDYAERLLQPKFTAERAKAIAKDLVRRYATHDFVIDRDEAKLIGTIYDEDDCATETVGLHVAEDIPESLEELLEWFAMNTHKAWGLGFVEEISKNAEPGR